MASVIAEFYDLPDGRKPAQEFLDSLDDKMRAKMARTVKLLETNGTNLREPYSKEIRKGLFELRAKVGSDISRVLYFFFHRGKAILTNGFIKKTQKTPESEIDRAERYKKEFLGRKENQ